MSHLGVQVLHLLQLGQIGAVDDIGWVYEYRKKGGRLLHSLGLFTYLPLLALIYVGPTSLASLRLPYLLPPYMLAPA